MTESEIQTQIRDAIGSRADTRLFRNSVGFYEIGERKIHFGLCPGSSDLIGIHSRVIRQEDVGRTVGLFLSIEVKRPQGSVMRPQQLRWLEMIRQMGGISMVARSPEEAQHSLLLP